MISGRKTSRVLLTPPVFAIHGVPLQWKFSSGTLPHLPRPPPPPHSSALSHFLAFPGLVYSLLPRCYNTISVYGYPPSIPGCSAVSISRQTIATYPCYLTRISLYKQARPIVASFLTSPGSSGLFQCHKANSVPPSASSRHFLASVHAQVSQGPLDVLTQHITGVSTFYGSRPSSS